MGGQKVGAPVLYSFPPLSLLFSPLIPPSVGMFLGTEMSFLKINVSFSRAST